MQIIATPGHTAGSLTVLVSQHGKAVLVAGDTGYGKKSWREGRLPGPVFDKVKMKNSLHWVKNMEEGGAVILASHDPEVMEQTIEL